MATSKRQKAQKARARRVGRAYLWDQIKAANGLTKPCPSNQDLKAWVHSHPEILPIEHRKRLLSLSGKTLPIEMGYLVVGKPTTAKRGSFKTRKAPDGFYSSWEWKKARFETIKKYGAVCMCCGSEERIVVDHIKPRSRFPEMELDLSNLQVLCNDCNMGKSNDDETDFRPDHYAAAEIDELALIAEAEERLH